MDKNEINDALVLQIIVVPVMTSLSVGVTEVDLAGGRGIQFQKKKKKSFQPIFYIKVHVKLITTEIALLSVLRTHHR